MNMIVELKTGEQFIMEDVGFKGKTLDSFLNDCTYLAGEGVLEDNLTGLKVVAISVDELLEEKI